MNRSEGRMIDVDFAVYCTVAVFSVAFVAGISIGHVLGVDAERTKHVRHNLHDAESMRAAIRDLDARTEVFAPLSSLAAQSSCLHRNEDNGRERARSTAIAPAPSRRCCSIGPEHCLCPECVADGVPPSP